MLLHLDRPPRAPLPPSASVKRCDRSAGVPIPSSLHPEAYACHSRVRRRVDRKYGTVRPTCRVSRALQWPRPTVHGAFLSAHQVGELRSGRRREPMRQGIGMPLQCAMARILPPAGGAHTPTSHMPVQQGGQFADPEGCRVRPRGPYAGDMQMGLGWGCTTAGAVV